MSPCFHKAGADSLIPKTAYTPTFYQWFVNKGQASKTPRVGSLVFYNWPDSVNRIQHVGIVEAVNPNGTITTIEGNTTSGNAGDQSNGGGVWCRMRSQSCVVGYGHPAYSGTPIAAPATGDKLVFPAWDLKPGEYLGNKNGPDECIGGFYGPVAAIEAVQRQWVRLGLVVRVSADQWRTTRWADGVWENPSDRVCRAWFGRYRPEQPDHNHIWKDDYEFMANQ